MKHDMNCLAVLRRHAPGVVAVLALLAVLAAPSAARAAVSCTVTGPSLTFGTVNPYSGFPYSTSGNDSYSCSNTGAAATIYACVSIGTGSGGTSATNRTLASNANKLPIQINGGASYPSQIGNGTSYPMEGVLTVSVGANATVTGTIAVVVAMPQPSSAPPPGSYTSTFSGTDAQVLYTTSSAPSSCTALASSAHSTAQFSFSVTATVATQCTVSATSLAFPTASVLTNPVSATATVSTTCNASTPVTVALDNGATGTAPTARQMKSGATNAITYGIYRDANATMPWGNTSGTNTAPLSTGTGTLTAYGRVPAQASPPPGSYSDVVNVIVTY